MTNQIVQKIRAHRIPIAHPLPNGGFKMAEAEAIKVIDDYVDELNTQARDATDKAVILQAENDNLRQQLATMVEQGRQCENKQPDSEQGM